MRALSFVFRASGAPALFLGLFPLATAGEPEPAAEWLPPFRVIELARVEQYDALPQDIARYRLKRRVFATEPGRVVYEDCERRLGSKKPETCTLVFVGAGGYGNVASMLKGAWDWWSPPQILLPPNPRVGARWSAIHQKRGGVSERTCEVLADESVCADGLEVRCHTAFPTASVVIGTHYCRGRGWVGEDVLSSYPDGHRFSSSSFALTIDGQPAPEPKGGNWNPME